MRYNCMGWLCLILLLHINTKNVHASKNNDSTVVDSYIISPETNTFLYDREFRQLTSKSIADVKPKFLLIDQEMDPLDAPIKYPPLPAVDSVYGIFAHDKNKYSFIPPLVNRKTIQYQSTYENIRIKVDSLDFISEFIMNVNSANKIQAQAVVSNIIPTITEVWDQHLKVNRIVSNERLVVNAENCGPKAVPVAHRTDGVVDTDLLIYLVGSVNCGPNTFAYGGPCDYDQFMRPTVGYLTVCLNDLRVTNDQVIAADQHITNHFAAQSLGHTLGFRIELFQYFKSQRGYVYGTKKKEVKCKDGQVKIADVPYFMRVKNDGFFTYEITLPTLDQMARNHFNCPGIAGVRLAEVEDSCFGGSYWSERQLKDDLMSPLYVSDLRDAFDFVEKPKASLFTLALFEDSSWYKPVYDDVISNPFGLGAGCQFIEDKCIINGEVPTWSSGYFCNDTLQFNSAGNPSPNTAYSCDPSHKSKSVCDLVDYSKPPISDTGATGPQAPFIYFNNPNLGPFYDTHADFCPMQLGLSRIDCTFVTQEVHFGYDIYGPESRCFDTDQVQSVCVRTTCNAATKTVDGFLPQLSQSFSCQSDGQLIDVNVTPPGKSFKIVCPRITSVCPQLFCVGGCSGRGTCDYSLPQPKCVCNDASDNTANCLQSTVKLPTLEPSMAPTDLPSISPTNSPSESPTKSPSELPSSFPSCAPSFVPSNSPSNNPSNNPSTLPSDTPSNQPIMLKTGKSGKSGKSHKYKSSKSSKSKKKSSSSEKYNSYLRSSKKKNSSKKRHLLGSMKHSHRKLQTATNKCGGGTGGDQIKTLDSSVSVQTSVVSLPKENPSLFPTYILVSPTKRPSGSPSTSLQPSNSPSANPSVNPSISLNPSTKPSNTPSVEPSSSPFNSPSINPSLSARPIKAPSKTPSSSPSSSGVPSEAPTILLG